jgi:hypothetical protein
MYTPLQDSTVIQCGFWQKKQQLQGQVIRKLKMKSTSHHSMLALDQVLTDSMREAAQEASIADGVVTDSSGLKTNKGDLRRGKWTPEEESYANRLIEEFKAGMLPIADGTTLRTFLSKLLHCDPMRISKKYVGNNCIGKVIFSN